MQLNAVSMLLNGVKMGTYTTNYNLFMPTVGETGWGTLVNGNFSTIDSTMKSLSNRITSVENEVNGALSCTSVTTTGKVTANGGIAGTTGTFSGAVTGATITLPAKTIGGISFINFNVSRNLTGDTTESDYLVYSDVTKNIEPLGSVIPDGAYVTLLARIVNNTTSRTITLIVNDKQYTATLNGGGSMTTLFNNLKVAYPTSALKIRTSVANQGYVETTLKMVSYL